MTTPLHTSSSEPGPPPAMTFDAGALLDPELAKHGPLDFLWGVDEFPDPPEGAFEGADRFRPPRYFRARLLGMRPFAFAIRITPPPDVDLGEWGVQVAKHLGVPWGGPPKEGDKAVWLPGITMARDAGGALGSCRRAFERLEGFQVGSAAIRVVAIRPKGKAHA